ncbi:SDR family oxidoreductase [Halioglobus maricola]|uniref:SDR family oxidoreductase n=2 Tax=Halioglobus maricola TaxID=2601894 RepID=A0A5P9NPZ0_9GAMM|nr:SDR family oxidoreductase [Halioglobus maricola]
MDGLFSLEGKVALVTGASSGLGAHFAKILAAAGATVVAAARRQEKLETLVADITAAGGQAAAVGMDVTDAASVTEGIADIEQTHGGIDILVNNAGVAGSRYSLNVTETEFDHIMNANLKGAWRVAQAVARLASANERCCSIINIASILGLRVSFGESVYAISKAAVVQMTKAMALELAPKGIRVNAIAPGYFATEMNSEYLNSDAGQAYLKGTPAGRMGDIDELSGPLLLLASEAGSFVNGAILPVDGGHLVKAL